MSLFNITINEDSLKAMIAEAVNEALDARMGGDEKLLTTSEVAKAARLHKSTVLRYKKSGKVRDYSRNGYPLFKLSEFVSIENAKYDKM